MPTRDEHPRIVGDIASVTHVSVNTKGGSLSATLKKGIRESLSTVGDRLTAAALEFASGSSVVLLSGGMAGSGATSIRVVRTGRNRFEIELDTGEEEEVDDLTAAFLMLKVDQFKKDRLRLLPAVSAEEWRAEMDEKFRQAEARAAAPRTEPAGGAG